MKSKNNNRKEYLKWSSIAMQGVGAIVALLFLGIYMDKKLNMTYPILTISGILLGVFYFFYSIFKAINSK